jgi:ABC-type Fe3+ transport system permease subunit
MDTRRSVGGSLWIHRWWLALVAALLTPWIGPHLDRYVPVGWVLIQARAEAPDAGFWIIASVLLVLGYTAWALLLSAFAAWLSRTRRRREDFNGNA